MRSFIFISLLSIFLINLVFSFGVVSPYWKENPLELNLGESKIINLTLQNMIGGQDINFKAELSGEGKKIASFVDENPIYFVKFGDSKVNVPILIKIPKDVGNITEIIVQVKFTQASNFSGEGMVKVGVSFNANFPVKIIPNSSKNSSFLQKYFSLKYILILVLSILGLMVLIAIILRFFPHKKY